MKIRIERRPLFAIVRLLVDGNEVAITTAARDTRPSDRACRKLVAQYRHQPYKEISHV